MTWITALSNSMKLWAMPCRATQDTWVMVESSDKKWSPGEGNGKPLQYSCLENLMNNMTQEYIKTQIMEKDMATQSSILAWRIPWTEEPNGLQSMESQRVGHNWATKPPPPPSHKSNSNYESTTQQLRDYPAESTCIYPRTVLFSLLINTWLASLKKKKVY